MKLPLLMYLVPQWLLKAFCPCNTMVWGIGDWFTQIIAQHVGKVAGEPSSAKVQLCKLGLDLHT